MVWYKRDLRIRDHAPLFDAAERARQGGAPVLPLFVFEPEYWALAEHDSAHYAFVVECLEELAEALRTRGASLTVRVGEMPEVLAELHRGRPITHLWSHRETGGAFTFARDLRVAAFCRGAGIPWTERGQDGVVRKLGSRDGWSARWNRRMRRPLVPAPEHIVATHIPAAPIPSAKELGLAGPGRPERQRGGESLGLATLSSFLRERSPAYREHMSSPVTAERSCSRLSPYLAWGAVSLRRAVQATARHRSRVQRENPAWAESLDAFRSRLQWHCHFIQKLESEPRIETENMHSGYDALWQGPFDEGRFVAWQRGETGYPLVDACMRSLRATGWLNFRMRAMLVSFATHLLWLPWRRPALHLAALFLDYEPGIHFSQIQMQAGTTGINALRIYNPEKQARQQDPTGEFIRRWVPELASIPSEAIFRPSTLGPAQQEAFGVVIGRDYPAPVVEFAPAYRSARRKLEEIRRQPALRTEAREVAHRHGSRRRARMRRGRG
ncbi:MAG: FAD-binding domain-containing protein [Myxococcota bacterium]